MEKNTTNALLKGIIDKVDSLCKKKSYPPSLLNYLYLIAYGMISTYGTDYSDLIYTTIEEIELLLGYEALNKQNSKEIIESAMTFTSNHKDAFVLRKVTKKEHSYEVQKQICILYDFEKEPKINPIFILEFLAHEYNRSLTSVKRSFFYLNDNLACRCGLYRYVLAQNSQAYASGKIISEVVNTLQTEDIIKEILALDYHDIKYSGITSILKALSLLSPETYASTRFANETALYRDLYNIPTYKEFINTNILEGDIDAIINDFDGTVGANAFDAFTTLYEEYNASLKRGGENNWQKEDVAITAALAQKGKSIISLYTEKKYPCIKYDV